ncbi:LysR family transcriptional regulator [Streptomyces iranensis]|uniref:DNA-binding transcriptional LysR family regulator n=1 Tax=Streptomyces iranensis TaxID=576784 RepID=A0A060ZWF5_9ACTN|nr:LysR family transcriptional regulator [Streptomyces iranensis]MBP2062294.1 DNA-binding transcriptional LysR family regulator [Streptomyces iranensis]CDR07509.1 LysR family transcriptional regulator [Streptomyces iranensis]
MATLRQLEYFATVVDTGSFTQAAHRLRVTQPALSHQMRALEQAVGGPLLERLPRTVRLTPMGRAMLPHARAALADVKRAQSAARQAGGLEAAELHLATLYSITLGVLPNVLRIWRQQHPGTQIRLFEHWHTNRLTNAMAAGQADLAVGPRPSGWDGPIHDIGIDEFVIVVPADDPATSDQATHIELTALADRAWVHFPPGNGLGDILDQACAAAGFQPRIAVRTEQTSAAPLLAAAGIGPTLVPAHIIPVGFDGRLLHPHPPVRRTLTAYTRTSPDPLTTAFIHTLTQHARLLPPHLQTLLHTQNSHHPTPPTP